MYTGIRNSGDLSQAIEVNVRVGPECDILSEPHFSLVIEVWPNGPKWIPKRICFANVNYWAIHLAGQGAKLLKSVRGIVRFARTNTEKKYDHVVRIQIRNCTLERWFVDENGVFGEVAVGEDEYNLWTIDTAGFEDKRYLATSQGKPRWIMSKSISEQRR